MTHIFGLGSGQSPERLALLLLLLGGSSSKHVHCAVIMFSAVSIIREGGGRADEMEIVVKYQRHCAPPLLRRREGRKEGRKDGD